MFSMKLTLLYILAKGFLKSIVWNEGKKDKIKGATFLTTYFAFDLFSKTLAVRRCETLACS